MEEVKIEVVSEGTVKPSSPTPSQLLYYKLSFLDQINPPVYIPLVLFYTSDEGNPNNVDATDVLSSRLKTSLSKTLTLFYPLAGRLKENTYIHCTDEGVPFIQTRVIGCRIHDVVGNPYPKALRRFIPFVLDDKSDDVILGIQFNVFPCGGIAVGLCLSHKIGDGLSMFMFAKTWSAICRGDQVIQHPEFVSADLFPPINISGFEPRTGISTAENVVSKRFIFRSDVINSLKAKYSKKMNVESTMARPPSRVESLSAFLWSRFAAATQVHANPNQACFVIHAVNLRTKFEPSLPDHSFGNLYRIAMTHVSPDMEGEYLDLVPKMRETVLGIDTEYVQKLRNGEEHLEFIKRRSSMFLQGEMISFNFTSWCRFPLYESDFGWGKPMWIGSPAMTFKNLLVFMDTKSGDGIEAYISLKEEDMMKLEKDEEFQARVSKMGKQCTCNGP